MSFYYHAEIKYIINILVLAFLDRYILVSAFLDRHTLVLAFLDHQYNIQYTIYSQIRFIKIDSFYLLHLFCFYLVITLTFKSYLWCDH